MNAFICDKTHRKFYVILIKNSWKPVCTVAELTWVRVRSWSNCWSTTLAATCWLFCCTLCLCCRSWQLSCYVWFCQHCSTLHRRYVVSACRCTSTVYICQVFIWCCLVILHNGKLLTWVWLVCQRLYVYWNHKQVQRCFWAKAFSLSTNPGNFCWLWTENRIFCPSALCFR